MNLKIIAIITIILFQISCRSEFSNGYCYPKDTNISDLQGNIKDSSVSIFPTYIYRENLKKLYTGMDTIFSKAQFGLWKAMGEKVLYNYYLDKDQIRFFWFQSLRKEQYLFRFIHKDEEYKVFLKIIRENKLRRDKDSVEYLKSIEFNDFAKKNYQEYLEKKKYFKIDSVINIDTLSEIAYCEPMKISKKSWERLISLLDSTGFWKSTPNNLREVLDGETWITEVHLKKAYWFTYETSPKELNRKAGEYAISLIGLTDRHR